MSTPYSTAWPDNVAVALTWSYYIPHLSKCRPSANALLPCKWRTSEQPAPRSQHVSGPFQRSNSECCNHGEVSEHFRKAPSYLNCSECSDSLSLPSVHCSSQIDKGVLFVDKLFARTLSYHSAEIKACIMCYIHIMACLYVYRGQKIQTSVERMFRIWKERRVYDNAFLKELELLIEPTRKAETPTKASPSFKVIFK